MINENEITRAAKFISEGKLVAMPTETVYGLAGNAMSDQAVAAIYAAKGRPSFNPLIVHVASIQDAEKYVTITQQARKLAEKFWPGPLTMVLPRKSDSKLSLLLSAGLDTVAIRSPAHWVARELLKATGLPLAAPSANRSGKISPTEAAHVRAEFGDKIFILDGGACKVGIESTVVDMTGETPVILRPGSITQEELKHVTNVAGKGDNKIKSPGMMESHYAPGIPLRMNATDVKEGEALLAFGKPIAGARVMENLSESENLEEAAANLFRMMRALDASGASGIAVMPIADKGLGIAINDRLSRAATKK